MIKRLTREFYLLRGGAGGEGAAGVFGAGIATTGGCISRVAVMEFAIAMATQTSSWRVVAA
jgi:hypothetical protein